MTELTVIAFRCEQSRVHLGSIQIRQRHRTWLVPNHPFVTHLSKLIYRWQFRRPFKFTRTSSDERQRRKSQPSESLPNNSSSAPPNLREDGSIREGTAAPQISSNSASQLLKPVHETDHKRRSSDFSRRLSEVDAGPLGLSVVYKPERDHTLDIVFIHGLGGTSHMTWSKNKDLELFWPYKFLSQEPEISQARILTFGYDADFLGSNITSSVLDFAKDLLFNLKNAKDDTKKNLRMGTVSIVPPLLALI